MTLLKEMKSLAAEMTAWRRHLHENPELSCQEYQTADFIEKTLQSFGLETTRLGDTGVVATIRGGQDSSGRKILLRADTDALPIMEDTNLPYASKNPGVMHACGHDGHTAMLLGAAKYLNTHRDFDGTVHLLFQPAEENGEGGPAMLAAGLFDKFPADSIFGLHNVPTAPLGIMGTRTGGMLSAADGFTVTLSGEGGHASTPKMATDILSAAAKAVLILKEGYKDYIAKGDKAVLSVTAVHTSSTATNVLPDSITVSGTFRSFDGRSQKALQAFLERTMREEASRVGAAVSFKYDRPMPVLMNAPDETKTAVAAARAILGRLHVLPFAPRTNGTEDFSTLLQARPGNYIAMGTGKWNCILPGAEVHYLHSPKFDFNDKALPIGAAYWVALTKKALPLPKPPRPGR